MAFRAAAAPGPSQGRACGGPHLHLLSVLYRSTCRGPLWWLPVPPTSPSWSPHPCAYLPPLLLLPCWETRMESYWWIQLSFLRKTRPRATIPPTCHTSQVASGASPTGALFAFNTFLRKTPKKLLLGRTKQKAKKALHELFKSKFTELATPHDITQCAKSVRTA